MCCDRNFCGFKARHLEEKNTTVNVTSCVCLMLHHSAVDLFPMTGNKKRQFNINIQTDFQ